MPIDPPADAARTEHDDAVLLDRVARGDRTAFEGLYHRYQPRLARYVYRVLRRAEPVDEIVNDTLLAVWRGAGRFEGRSRVSTWILGIAYRLALKSLARSRREPPTVEASILEQRPSPEGRSAHRREQRLTIEAALETLSVEHRTVVELTYVHGLSYPEIAQVVGIPVGTVKTRMFHARRAMRRLLAGPTAARPEAQEAES